MQRPMVVPPNGFFRNDMPGRDIEDPKAALRRLFRGSRNAFVAGLSVDRRVHLESDLAGVVAPLLGGHRIIASYAAVGPEIDPHGVENISSSQRRLGPSLRWDDELGDGKTALDAPTIAFPRVTGRTMAFHATTRPDLTPRTLGIPEPDAGAPQVTPGLLLVPLLAVTPAGVRLGQGGGYYDRMLKALRAGGPVVAIGLAWDGQLTDALPRDPWDELLDWVATPTRLVDCRKAR